MNNTGVNRKKVKELGKQTKQAVQYHSVEFSLDGLVHIYQFRLWSISPMPMCLLVGENSNLLERLKMGETIEMRYYPNDSSFPPVQKETAIKEIIKKDDGRFKGHYLVGLEVLAPL